jgi:hypothetical protein
MRALAGRILSAVLILPLPAPAIGQLVPLGSEFQVTTYTAAYESNGYGPRVGAAANGAFVVAWQNEPDYQVSARRFASSGAPVGTDFEVAPFLSYRPALAVGPTGEFTVAWEKPDADLFGVFAQRFSSTGSPVGTEVQVNTYVTSDQDFQVATGDGMGNVLIAWESRLQDGHNRGIFAQTFDSTGAAAGSEFQVNAYTFGSQAGPVVAGDPAGGFVVGWSDYRNDGFLPRILAHRYDGAGNSQGGEFQVNTYTTCILGDFGFSVGPSGDLVAVFNCRDRDGDSSGIFGRRFSSAGTPYGSEFQVNTYTFQRQNDPSVAHDENDGFAVAWYSDHEGNNFDIFVKRYNSAGVASGPEFQVNSYTFALQAYPEIVSLPRGEFVVAWTSEHQDGYLTGVFAQRLRPAGTPIKGKKVTIKTPPSGPARNKLVLLSKDPAITTPQSVDGDPRCAPLGSGTPAAGGRLHVSGQGGELTIDLPCTSWVADAGRTRFTYRDASGATCKRVTVADGHLLKAICSGPQVAYSLGTSQGEVMLSLSMGDAGSPSKYCMAFGAETGAEIVKDGSSGRIYQARDAGELSFCP